MDMLKNTLLILLINSILFMQGIPVYALQTKNLSFGSLISVSIENKEYTEQVYKDRDNIVIFDDVTLYIPAAALSENIIITMNKLYSIEGLNVGMANVTQGAAAYRFGPDGINFRRDIKIVIPFDPEIARSETALSNLYSWFFNNESGRWEKLDRLSIDRDNFTITSQTDHFTDMINSTLQLPEGPAPINFNPNSIKELKSADPRTGIPGLSGLEPSQTGDASFDIPLRIPRGRGGATPSLALTYSNELMNGWMGRGFNISSPSITTDTRFGLPEYDRNDTYLYKGEELIPISTSGRNTLYKPRKDSSFEQIIRKSESLESDFWEISDKSGMIFTYGTSEGWLGPNRGDKTKVYTWYLTGVKDPNGNTVSYNYIYDSDNNYTYLESIVYSGYESVGLSQSGKYKILFDLEDDPGLKRKDRRIDARGKFPSKLVELLKQVRVLYDEKLIRSYLFTYGINEFGQTQLHSYSEYDKSEEKFYTYAFDYHKLPENDAGGYDGFGTDTLPLFWNTSFDNLSESISGSGGASLSVGISFRIFGRTIAGVNVRGGYNYTGGMNKSLMTDINGDGLPDFIETSSKNLGTYINNGLGFDNTLLNFGGLGSNLNVTGQNGVTIGAGASLGPASASITGQFSWSFAKTLLADFNGDGFVDQLERGSDYYRKNNGTSFEKVPLLFDNTGSADPIVPTAADLAEEEKYKKAFYQEDPLVRWNSAASGTVEIKQTVEAVSSDISKDGLDFRTYFKDRTETISLGNTGDKASEIYSFTVSEGDDLYFHLDPGEIEKGDDVKWDNTITYKEIDLLETLDLISSLDPPRIINNSLPFSELSHMYNRTTLKDSDENSYYRYTRKGDWINFVNGSNYQKMYLYNMFIPKLVTLNQYLRMKEVMTFDPVLFLQGYEYDVIKRQFLRKNDFSDLQLKSHLNEWTDSEKLNCSGFIWFDGSLFNPNPVNTARFIKSRSTTLGSHLYDTYELTSPGTKDISGNIFVESISTLNGDLEITYDGAHINYPESTSKTETSNSLSFSTSLNGYEYSVTYSGKKYLIESISKAVFEQDIKKMVLEDQDVNLKDYRIIQPELHDQLHDSFLNEDFHFYSEDFLNKHFSEISSGLYSELLSNMIVDDQLLFQTLYTENISTSFYELKSDASETNILFVLEKIYENTDYSESLFSENNEMFLMTDVEFSEINDSLISQSYSWEQFYEKYDDTIKGISYFTIQSDIILSDIVQLKILLKGLNIYEHFYRENSETSSFEINPSLEGSDQFKVLGKLYDLTDLPETIFISDDDFFLIGDQEFSELNFHLQENSLSWENILEQYSDISTGNSFYAIQENLTEEFRDLFSSVLEDFLFQKIHFPYYELNGEMYSLKSSLSAEDEGNVSDFFRTNNIYLWNTFSKVLEYLKGNPIPVEPYTASGGEDFNSLFSGFTSAESNSSIGIAAFPDMDGSGNIFERAVYIPVYNFEQDFSTDNFINYDILDIDIGNNTELEGEPLLYYIDPLYGGYRNWSYGVWTGYFDWDEEGLNDLYQDMIDNNFEETAESDTPPLLTSASQNYSSVLNSTRVETIGADNNMSLDLDSIIGPVSSTNRTEIDDNGGSTVLSNDFCVVIQRDYMHPSRKGGDSYNNIPKGSGSSRGDSIPFLSKSKSNSLDTSAGVSLVGIGGSIGLNTGDSWQYGSLIDLNGDRYPDLIETSRNGSTSAQVSLGTGEGFFPVQNATIPFGKLSENSIRSLSFGGSASASSGNQRYTFSDDGKPEKVTVETGGRGSSVSISANGSIGVSINQTGFRDINGDGLVDQLHRSGTGDFRTGLNSGDLQFLSGDSWGHSFSEQFWGGSIFTGDLTKSSGLSYSTFGSFGGTFSIGLGIVGGSLGFSVNTNTTLTQLIDMNGDGLPDQVIKEDDTPYFLVRYNLGDTFSDSTVKLYRPEWIEYDLEALFLQDLGTIKNNLSGSSVGGKSVSGSAKEELPDRADSQFSEFGDPFSVNDTISCSKGLSINLGASLEFLIPCGFILFSIEPGINGSYANTSTSLSMMDINGDGLPDHVLTVSGQMMQVKLNGSFNVGLLETIQLPSGGSYQLEYATTGNTVEMPQSRTVLQSVTMSDGFDDDLTEGSHKYTTSYLYQDGYYNRDERLFYGFGTVKTILGDNSVQTVHYSNQKYSNDTANMNYYWRDLIISKSLVDESGNLLLVEINGYEMEESHSSLSFHKRIFSPLLTSSSKEVFEEGSSDSLTSRIEYLYKDYGNIIAMKDLGIISDHDDDIYLTISYADKSGFTGYLPSLPETLEVRNFDGDLFRRREGSYDHKGNMKSLTQYSNNNDAIEYLLSYGDYGNLALVRGPGKPGSYSGPEMAYEYDSEVSTYVTKISQGNSSAGIDDYISVVDWDLALGVEKTSIDINGNIQQKQYDDFGRLIEIRTPYDTGIKASVRYEYNIESFPCNAITYNKLRFDSDDETVLKTSVLIDGLGRVVQTGKEGEIYSEGTSHYGWNLSGRVLYDSKGRIVQEGQNSFSEGTDLPGIAEMRKPTTKIYDNRDRILQVILPDETYLETDFNIVENQLVAKTRDPEGNITENRTDMRGNITQIVKRSGAGNLLTSSSYAYNIMGELLEAIDDQGNAVSLRYDQMGRNLSVNSPDAGYIISVYDESGNLIEKTDNNLRAMGGIIRYEYDGLNRLIKIDYPFIADTTMIYGEADRDDNGSGRLISSTDESGTIVNKYGKLGEIVNLSRTLNRLSLASDPESAEMTYKSDYLGRMEQITYPDGEIVTYGYDSGGQVTSVTGDRLGVSTEYIKKIGYDEFGQRTYIFYENDIETIYEYDEDRRWLKNLQSTNDLGREIQNLSYNFDNIGNIIQLDNDSELYRTTQTYEYDELYQLTGASGAYESRSTGSLDYTSDYSQNFTFDSIGNMQTKSSSQYYSPARVGAGNLNYEYDFEYYKNKPHQAERIGNLWYIYDDNGNVIEEREGGHSSSENGYGGAGLNNSDDLYWTGYGFGLYNSQGEEESVYCREYTWDEENRLKESSDINHTVEYLYDSSGERTVKNSSLGETLYFNSMWQVTPEDEYNTRQSKHIYVGESRIATRLNYNESQTTGFEEENTYYYHCDHLGSANIVSDSYGEVYEHLEYTPYGEMWIEETAESLDFIPFRFTAKEWDEETRLYYMSARYQNPMTSRWMSADPAGLGLANPNREGFNIIESLNWYSYAGNNPIIYRDPTGMRLDDDLETDIKRKTHVVVERSPETDQNNDTIKVMIGETLVSEYGGVQSEKNMKSDSQTKGSDRAKPGTEDGSPVGTLPVGDDYELLMLEKTPTYDKALSISSKTAQLPGTSKKGISRWLGMLIHSFSSITKEQPEGWSLGCQVLPDNSFTDFRNDLEGLGFKNGDSLPMSIKQLNFVERR